MARPVPDATKKVWCCASRSSAISPAVTLLSLAHAAAHPVPGTFMAALPMPSAGVDGGSHSTDDLIDGISAKRCAPAVPIDRPVMRTASAAAASRGSGVRASVVLAAFRSSICASRMRAPCGQYAVWTTPELPESKRGTWR